MHKDFILTWLFIFIKLNCGPDSLQDSCKSLYNLFDENVDNYVRIYYINL